MLLKVALVINDILLCKYSCTFMCHEVSELYVLRAVIHEIHSNYYIESVWSGGHWLGQYLGTLSSLSSLCNSFEFRLPVNSTDTDLSISYNDLTQWLDPWIAVPVKATQVEYHIALNHRLWNHEAAMTWEYFSHYLSLVKRIQRI